MNVENFRSALHGFNRTDVVQFVQSMTMQHEKELRVLKEENARLQKELSDAQADAEAAKAEAAAKEDALQAALREVSAAKAEAEEASKAAENAAPDAALNGPILPAGGTTPDFNELELAAYRRAEMTERLSRERANASAEQMRSIFAQATEKLSLSSQDLNTLLDTFRDDFDKLRRLLADTQDAVSESSASLRAAADVCGEL